MDKDHQSLIFDLSKTAEALSPGQCGTQGLLQQLTFFPTCREYECHFVLFTYSVSPPTEQNNSVDNQWKLESDSTVKGSACHRLKFVFPPNSSVEALTCSETVFADRGSKEVIKFK